MNETLDGLIAICKVTSLCLIYRYRFYLLAKRTNISCSLQLQRMVEQEDLQFHEEYMNDKDPSILHFLLASGDDVCHTNLRYIDCLLKRSNDFLVLPSISFKVSSKQLRDDLMTMLIAGHETSAAVLTWTFYLLSKV